MTELQKIDFDGWSLRVTTGELERNGVTTRLQEQPLKVLLELLSRPGELVTREQLIARLWPKEVVDFDGGLNAVVRKLRIALQDDTGSPRYIETVPRKGYRFVATIQADPTGAREPHGALPLSTSADSRELPLAAPPSRKRSTHIYAYALAVGVLLVASLVMVDRWRQPAPDLLAASPSTVLPTLAVLPLRSERSNAADDATANGITALLRDRLARIEGLSVMASSSSELASAHFSTHAEIARSLQARYLLIGRVARQDANLHLHIELLRGDSGATVWSKSFSHPDTALGPMREAIVNNVADKLRLTHPVHGGSTNLNLQAYEIFARADRLLSNQRVVDAQDAAQLYARATELDPDFARAYIGIAQAVIQPAEIAGAGMRDASVRAERALARALELDPALGEAWIQRGRVTADLAKAEEYYRRGLQLAPGYAAGFAYFGGFLADRHRRGEASALIDRGRQLDPLSLQLRHLKSVMIIFANNDVAAQDALLRESLTLDPNHPATLSQLLYSRYLWSGELAEAMQLAERLYAHQPESLFAHAALVALSLDLGNVDEATRIVQSHPTLFSEVDLAQYRRDPRRAAEKARDLPIRPRDSTSPVAEAIRDGAILSGEFGLALKRLETVYREWDRAPISNRSTALVYAHTLMLSGDASGRRLAESTLALLDTEAAGRPHGWFCRERAAALAILGRNNDALDELALSAKLKRVQRWWYTTEVDPLFAALRKDPRFAAIKQEGDDHLARQRAILESLRREEKVSAR